jgi:Ca-activated chloride channel homolog
MRLRVWMFTVASAALAAIAIQAVSQSSAQAPPATTASDAATIVGSVVDENLAQVAAARVTLRRGNAIVSAVTTGADGAFRLLRIAPGDYQVSAEHSGFDQVTRDVRVRAGVSSVRLPLVLTRPNAQDQKVAGASGTLWSETVAVLAEAPQFSQPSAAPIAAPPQVRPEAPGTGGGRGGRGGGGSARVGGASSASPMAYGLYNQSSVDRVGPRIVNGAPATYAHVEAGSFHRAIDDPLSTFGADVDTASFSNVRRFLQSGQLPPSDAVRVEEFVNYFHFDYPTPRSGHPIGMTTEIGDCPWALTHKLVLIGARAVPLSTRTVEGRNIVLLIDVSGSMSPQERLPLVKAGLRMFVGTLGADDRIAIVTYAGYSGIALPSTPVRERETILAAIDRLGAGGSTNGAQGIITAYRVARQAFIPGGVNRVILATDGDFNVGVTSRDQLLQLIQREKESGVFLSVLGVGTDNLQDATMEMLADRGNGHYAYLDSLQEARRVLVTEAGSTLETVAKDTKFQVEFNPAHVASWKLLGYENRVMAAEDFNDDRKDGGELGAGHTVTVLYEVVPVGAGSDDDGAVRSLVDPLKYQTQGAPAAERARTPNVSSSPEWLTVKVRYQLPEGEQSRLIQVPLSPSSGARPVFLPFASAVAEFGMLLRQGHADSTRWDGLSRRLNATSAPGIPSSERDQLVELVALAKGLGH